MGFYAYPSNRAPTGRHSNNTRMPITQIPLFLFPGILGSGSYEFASLIKSLKELYPERTIYVYNDPIFSIAPEGAIKVVTDEDNSVVVNEDEPTNFASFAEQITQEMFQCMPSGPMPFILCGYSFGGALAAKIAAHLQKEGCDIRLFIIDAPTPEMTQSYFKARLPINDLVAIVKRAGKLSGFKLDQQSLELDKLSRATLEECIDHLVRSLRICPGRDEGEAEEQLNYLINLVKRNLIYLLEDPGLELKLAMDDEENKITCLITKELESKYGPTAGWSKYNPQYITDARLLEENHQDLIAAKNCPALVETFASVCAISAHQIICNQLMPLGYIDPGLLLDLRRTMQSRSPRMSSPITSPGNESADSDDEKTQMPSPTNNDEQTAVAGQKREKLEEGLGNKPKKMRVDQPLGSPSYFSLFSGPINEKPKTALHAASASCPDLSIFFGYNNGQQT